MGNELDDEYGTQTGRNVAVFATETDWFAVWDGTDGERATVAEVLGLSQRWSRVSARSQAVAVNNIARRGAYSRQQRALVLLRGVLGALTAGRLRVHASTRVCARSSLLDPKRLWLHRSIAEQVGITHRTVHRRGCNHCNHCCCLGQPQPPRTWAENRHRCCCCCLCAASRRHMRVSLDCVLALQALHRWAAQHYSLRPEIFPPSLPLFANPAGPRPTHHDRPSQQQPAPVPASDTRPAPRQSITATPPRQGPIHVP